MILPCTNCPKPGKKKLAIAAITLPADPSCDIYLFLTLVNLRL
ncbi:protein of unknown function [Shewanella benthica]|uniref:Uncharacterized protein n=1 Tax=Shewanella benthica TaxID=43661 RepID=A0A330LZB7_9GAMM|nr:protein of unknown function [Shewanella benthica]